MEMNTSDGDVRTSTPGMDDIINNTKVGPVWFATILKGDTSRKSVNFRTLVTPAGNGADVVVLKELVSFVNERLRNTFDVMESMLENVLLLIRSVSLILKNWTPNAKIMMYDVCNIPVWVKFYDILITVFTKDGLIAIATKLTKTLMLDSYTVAMCTYSWGKDSCTRAMVELQDDVELKDTIVVTVLKFVGDGYTVRTIRVEYKWTHPKCLSCKVFGHVLDECLKKSVSDVLKSLKNPRQAVRGVKVGPNVGFKHSKQVYQPFSKMNNASTNGKKKQPELYRQEQMLDGNLMLVDDDEKLLNKVDSDAVNSDSESYVKVAYDEIAQFMASRGANDASLYENEDYDIYDNYDIEAPECPFIVNRHTYRKGYYLADGIYPAWSTFVKTFSVARDEKTLKFKRVQEAARKDIERTFGVLQDERFEVNLRDVFVNPAPNIVRDWVERCDLHVRKTKELRDRKTHTDLRQDLMEHIWNNDDE
ncbi:alpha/beta hydrolases superfamily protein [Tanacetum coccineum]